MRVATYSQARSAAAEYVAARWRLTAVQRCRALLSAGEHAAALAALHVAQRNPMTDEPLRRAADELALLIADPVSPAAQ